MAGTSLSADWVFTASRDEIDAHQVRMMQAQVGELLATNDFYGKKFREAGLTDAHDFKSLGSLAALPFTFKDELVADQEAHPPYGSNLTYPMDRYTRLHQSSGTKGKRPLRWLDTHQNWDWLMGCWATIFAAAELNASDRFFFPFSFGPFLGFWAGFEAAVRGGYLTLPGGGMTTRARLKFLTENQVTVIGCTPTYALHLAEVAWAESVDLAGSSVHTLIVAGEPGGNIPEVKGKIESEWGARCLDHSGMTEIGSLGFEFRKNPGTLYMIESACIAEVLDPETGDPVERGERGELVLTNLGRVGSPLIRYRTGDLVRADANPCPCGSSLIPLAGGILGRADDMVLIRGNNVYPAAVEGIIRRFAEIAEFEVEVFRAGGLAQVRITVECLPGIGSNDNGLPRQIADAVKDSLNFRPEVRMVSAGELPRYEMKARRFKIDPSYHEE